MTKKDKEVLMYDHVKRIEKKFHKMAKDYEVGEICVALHNVLCHGDLFPSEYKFGKGDKLLGNVVDAAHDLWTEVELVEAKNKKGGK